MQAHAAQAVEISVATQINFKNIKIYHKLHQIFGQNIKRK